MEDATVRVPSPVPPRADPPADLDLAAGELHVWQASLDGPADPALLSAEEEARADRALNAAGRHRFQRGRTLLRNVLAGYTGADPAWLRFGEGPEGKPFLRAPGSYLRFNLSHAADAWALVVSRGCDVGIDVERLDRRADLVGVARRVFAGPERDAVAAAGDDGRAAVFFRHWAAREAVVKGLGTGMLTPEVEFEIDAAPGRPLAVRSEAPGFRWWIAHFEAPENHVGVVAAERTPESVSCFRITT